MTVTQVDHLPRFELLSKIDKISSLTHNDAEANCLQQTDFRYYTLDDLHSDKIFTHKESMTSFSTIHFNIRSLSANHDGLTMWLSDFQHTFDVIGLSETKITSTTDLTSNIDIEGYDFVSKPTLSNAGGVGLYIKQGMQFHVRDDLSSGSTTRDFEALWIEINRKPYRNLLCGILYRHPNSRPEEFTRYLFSKIDSLNRE